MSRSQSWPWFCELVVGIHRLNLKNKPWAVALKSKNLGLRLTENQRFLICLFHADLWLLVTEPGLRTVCGTAPAFLVLSFRKRHWHSYSQLNCIKPPTRKASNKTTILCWNLMSHSRFCQERQGICAMWASERRQRWWDMANIQKNWSNAVFSWKRVCAFVGLYWFPWTIWTVWTVYQEWFTALPRHPGVGVSEFQSRPVTCVSVFPQML